ncbi:hypothetical protein GQ607_015975 [Colletotrichum asianum]|uniref:Uncharacterized protein n=1 Tax=Colletotrichum asianum TaxID=702518 RepID=A0A8H3W1X4_9PEZI|nr:hypothetical protein GQ607_015975 [Colletotrichum asianum]
MGRHRRSLGPAFARSFRWPRSDEAVNMRNRHDSRSNYVLFAWLRGVASGIHPMNGRLSPCSNPSKRSAFWCVPSDVREVKTRPLLGPTLR